MRLLYDIVRGYIAGITCLIVLLRSRGRVGGMSWGCGFFVGFGSILAFFHWFFRTLCGV